MPHYSEDVENIKRATEMIKTTRAGCDDGSYSAEKATGRDCGLSVRCNVVRNGGVRFP